MVGHRCLARLVLVVVILGGLVGGAGAAERVEEVWRSPWGVVRSPDTYWGWPTLPLTVNPGDSSVWVAAGANVTHLAGEGQVLSVSEALNAPARAAVDPADGSCWVLEGVSGRVLHFDDDGALVSATPFEAVDGLGDPLQYWLTPSPSDGSVWLTGPRVVARIEASGVESWRREYSLQHLVRIGAAPQGRAVVDPEDGSAWVLDGEDLVRLEADGTEMWRVSGAGVGRSVAEDVRDKSVWTRLSGEVTHVSSEGGVLGQATEGREVGTIEVSPLDGSVWVEYYDLPAQTAPLAASFGSYGQDVVHLDTGGEERWRSEEAGLVALNGGDGSAWLATGGELVHVSSDHEELSAFAMPERLLGFDPNDNSWWVMEERKIRHLAADGAVLWEERLEQLHQLWSSNDWVLEDGSCWVMDRPSLWADGDEFVHLSAAGEELERRAFPEPSFTPEGLAISPFDGSWWVDASRWVEGSFIRALLHLDEEGTEVGGSAEVGWLEAIDGTDGALWTAQNFPPVGSGYVRRLSAEGSASWVKEFAGGALAIAVDPADGSAWVSTSPEAGPTLALLTKEGNEAGEIALPEGVAAARDLAVSASDGSVYGVSGDGYGQGYAFRLAPDGSVIWLSDDLLDAEEIAVDPRDGSAWVVDLGTEANQFSEGSAVVHYGAEGTELWRGTTFNMPQAVAVSPDGTVWVSDWQNGQMVHLGVESLPFLDVASDCWAWEGILGCYTAGVVEGYPDGLYRPEASVTRDQMAVYVSRALVGEGGTVPAGPGEPSFSDVGTDHWAYDSIEYAASQGVVEGYEEGDYKPDVEVTRDQMAVYMARAMVAPSGEAALEDYVPADPRNFPDVASDFWAYKQVEYCVEHGVVQGYDDGLYHPDWVVTRDQMAVYVARAFGL